jgi:hypothetical protein
LIYVSEMQTNTVLGGHVSMHMLQLKSCVFVNAKVNAC